MRFLRVHLFEISIVGILLVLFFVSRLYQLTSLPIFTDEAIYLRWAQVAENDASWRFISLTDGKQPLFIWLVIISMKFFQDPLMAGRIVSVFAGVGTVIGLFFLGRELFRNTKIGLFAALLYVIYPMGLVYDRMALYDSLVGMFAVWALYVEVLLVRHIRLDIAFILAFVLGGGMLTKTNAFFSAAFLPFTLLLFQWKQPFWKKKLFYWIVYAGLAVGIAYLYYSILRLSPFFHIIDEKNTTFVYPLQEIVQFPLATIFEKFQSLGGWVLTYMTIPVLGLVLLSFVLEKQYRKEKILLFLVFLMPFVYLAIFGKVIYPRFILFMTLPLLLLAAAGLYTLLTKIRRKAFAVIIFLLVLFLPLKSDVAILIDFKNAPIPEADLYQFYTGWPAGGGVKEAVAFFEKESTKGPIFVGTEGTFGLMPASLELYLAHNPNISLLGIWPIKDTLPQELIDAREKMPTYVLFYQPCTSCFNGIDAPPLWPVTEVFRIEKGPGTYLRVYKL